MLEIITMILAVVLSFWAGYRVHGTRLEEKDHVIELLIHEILHLRGEEVEMDGNEKSYIIRQRGTDDN